MMFRIQSIAKFLLVAALLMLPTACGSLGGSSSGTSDGTVNYNYQWPANIIGKAITFTVTDPQTAGIPYGYKITWNYGSGGQVQGHNPVTGETVTPNDYVYSISGNHGVVTVDYYQYGLHAWEEFTMTASSSTTGTYTYRADTASGQGVKTAAGTYAIDSSSGVGGTGTGGNNSTTGQITIWNSKGVLQTGSILVKVDSSSVGYLTGYYTSAPTSCGANNNASITLTLPVGTHTFSAVDGTTTWSTSTFSITAGGCLLYQIR